MIKMFLIKTECVSSKLLYQNMYLGWLKKWRKMINQKIILIDCFNKYIYVQQIILNLTVLWNTIF